MPESTTVKVKRDAQIAATDGVNTHTVAREVGDFNYDVPDYVVNHFPDRGSILSTPSLRQGDDQPMTGGWTQYLTDLGDTAEPEAYQTALDLFHRYVGGYTDDVWSSTLGTNSDVETFTVQYTVDGSPFGEADKTLTFPFCVLRASVAEGDPDTITVAFTSWALRPTLT